MTSAARAVARQSMERTSSPPTYSRSESNSVPCPRTITADRPSSSRSRASRDGRCLREVNGGSTRSRHGTTCEPCRAGQPERADRADGHPVGEPVAAPGRAQRRHDPAALAGGYVDRVPLLRGAGAGRPGVAQPAAHPPPRRVGDGEPHRRASRRAARRRRRRASSRSGADRPGQREVDRDAATSSSAVVASRRPARRHTAGRRRPRRRPPAARARPVSATRRHHQRGTGTDAEDAVEHRVGRHALELGLGPQLDPVPQRRPGQRLDVVGGHVVAAGQPGPGPRRRHQRRSRRAARRRAAATARRGWPGPGRRRSRRPRARSTPGAPRPGRPRARRRRPPAATPAARRSRGSKPSACRVSDADLVVAGGQRHRQLEQEPVELRLGQRVGALVLHRVLGGDHDERVGQHPRGALDGDLPLLHRLQQRRLRLRRRAVDLVGEQQVGEDRPLAEGERRRARVVDQRPGDVARHQVGGELHPLGVQRQGRREGAHQQRLGHAGHALEQHVAAAEQRDDQPGDGGVLADDGLGDLGPQGAQRLAGVRCIGRRSCLRSVRRRLGREGVTHGRRTSLSRASRSSASRTSAASSAGAAPYRSAATSGGVRPVRAATASTTAGCSARAGRPSSGTQPRPDAAAQRVGCGVAGAGAPVEPGPALDGLGRPHHHRQRLDDDRAEPPGPPQRDQEQRDERAGPAPTTRRRAPGRRTTPAAPSPARRTATGGTRPAGGSRRAGRGRARRCPRRRGGCWSAAPSCPAG